MKKLSEIQNEEYICIGDIETGIMTKQDYLDSKEYQDKEPVDIFEAVPIPAVFSWDYVVQCYEDEQHEDWGAWVGEQIEKHPKLKEAEELVNSIFASSASYSQGDSIENDML